jgi:hypothetical protein
MTISPHLKESSILLAKVLLVASRKLVKLLPPPVRDAFKTTQGYDRQGRELLYDLQELHAMHTQHPLRLFDRDPDLQAYTSSMFWQVVLIDPDTGKLQIDERDSDSESNRDRIGSFFLEQEEEQDDE